VSFLKFVHGRVSVYDDSLIFRLYRQELSDGNTATSGLVKELVLLQFLSDISVSRNEIDDMLCAVLCQILKNGI